MFWLVHNSELHCISLKQLVMMIVTNSLEQNGDHEIVQRLQYSIQAIQVKQPATTILLLGILHKRNMEGRIANLNTIIEETITRQKVKYADAAMIYLKSENTNDGTLVSDGLHPNAIGCEKGENFIVVRKIFKLNY